MSMPVKSLEAQTNEYPTANSVLSNVDSCFLFGFMLISAAVIIAFAS